MEQGATGYSIEDRLPPPGRSLRLGMVGGGRGAFIGAVHAIAARMDNRYELVAGCLSSDPERSRLSARDWFIAPDRAYDCYQEMAEAEAAREDGIDVVSIVTPNHLHHANCRAFLDRGIHVICDKPLTTSLEDALDLVARVRESGLVLALTHVYSGYPMVRQARAMIAAGELGPIRLVHVEYLQDWLTEAIETTGDKQASWRTDPSRSGPAGCIADIGSHAFHLASFVTGLEVTSLAAMLHIFVPNRRLDDNAHVMLRFANGAHGTLIVSQVAPGNECGLRLRVYGEKAGLEWHQENPNRLRVTRLGQPAETLSRGGSGLYGAAARLTRVPRGHPEGYLEAFANIYAEAAVAIEARQEGRHLDHDLLGLPTVEDGARGVKFTEAALESSRNDGAWVEQVPTV